MNPHLLLIEPFSYSNSSLEYSVLYLWNQLDNNIITFIIFGNGKNIEIRDDIKIVTFHFYIAPKKFVHLIENTRLKLAISKIQR